MKKGKQLVWVKGQVGQLPEAALLPLMVRRQEAMWKNVHLAIYGVSVEAPLPSVPH